jgi:bifunctional non-homologous end joining protein LigD
VSIHFLKPMECLSVKRLPTGAKWTYEIKLDGFRLQAIRTQDRVALYSRHPKLMTGQFPQIAKELASLLSPGTILDGELAALDDLGRPRFNLLQNYRPGSAHLAYFVFDMLVHEGRDITRLTVSERRTLLHLSFDSGEYAKIAEWTADREGIEGIIAKRAELLAPVEALPSRVV